MSSIPLAFKDKNICILGLGYVGLTLATVMAETGFNVNGIEIRDDVLELLNQGKPHFFEPGLEERLGNIIRTGKLTCNKTIPVESRSSVYIITVGTPLGDNGKARIDMITNVAGEISSHLKNEDLVIMRSTVRLGTTRDVVMPILKESGADFDLAFCPERTIEGNALNELRELPQIVGGLNLNSAVRASQLFHLITPTVVRVSDIETAELIKMIDNSYRDVTLAYSNEIARITDAVGISAAEAIKAGTLGYPRVTLPVPGPVGGPCLAKDPYILAEGLEPFNIRPEITMAARKVNERQPAESAAYVADVVKQISDWPEKPVITLMGIAFKGKPETDDLRGTMARPIFWQFKKYFPNAVFRGFDPIVAKKTIADFGLEPFEHVEAAAVGANLLVIMNNHPFFAKIPIENLAEKMARPSLIYDFWNNFNAADLNLPAGTGYAALGSHGKALLPEGKPR
ncbi:nucleotide sugar dehydrogenase [Thermodesulfobacteriota bacterium]